MTTISPEDLAYVKAILPEINLLEDREIADRVARIWVKAWRETTWERLEEACFAPDITGPSLNLSH